MAIKNHVLMLYAQLEAADDSSSITEERPEIGLFKLWNATADKHYWTLCYATDKITGTNAAGLKYAQGFLLPDGIGNITERADFKLGGNIATLQPVTVKLNNVAGIKSYLASKEIDAAGRICYIVEYAFTKEKGAVEANPLFCGIASAVSWGNTTLSFAIVSNWKKKFESNLAFRDTESVDEDGNTPIKYFPVTFGRFKYGYNSRINAPGVIPDGIGFSFGATEDIPADGEDFKVFGAGYRVNMDTMLDDTPIDDDKEGQALAYIVLGANFAKASGFNDTIARNHLFTMSPSLFTNPGIEQDYTYRWRHDVFITGTDSSYGVPLIRVMGPSGQEANAPWLEYHMEPVRYNTFNIRDVDIEGVPIPGKPMVEVSTSEGLMVMLARTFWEDTPPSTVRLLRPNINFVSDGWGAVQYDLEDYPFRKRLYYINEGKVEPFGYYGRMANYRFLYPRYKAAMSALARSLVRTLLLQEITDVQAKKTYSYSEEIPIAMEAVTMSTEFFPHWSETLKQYELSKVDGWYYKLVSDAPNQTNPAVAQPSRPEAPNGNSLNLKYGSPPEYESNWMGFSETYQTYNAGSYLIPDWKKPPFTERVIAFKIKLPKLGEIWSHDKAVYLLPDIVSNAILGYNIRGSISLMIKSIPYNIKILGRAGRKVYEVFNKTVNATAARYFAHGGAISWDIYDVDEFISAYGYPIKDTIFASKYNKVHIRGGEYDAFFPSAVAKGFGDKQISEVGQIELSGTFGYRHFKLSGYDDNTENELLVIFEIPAWDFNVNFPEDRERMFFTCGIRECALMVEDEVDISQSILAQTRGRVFRDTWKGRLSGEPRKTVDSEVLTPMEIIEMAARLSNYSSMSEGAAPVFEVPFEWGKEYPTDARKFIATEKYDNPAFEPLNALQIGTQFINATAGVTNNEIIAAVCKDFYITHKYELPTTALASGAETDVWLGATALPVSAIYAVDNVDPTEDIPTISLHELRSHIEIREPDYNDIFCEPVLKYDYVEGAGFQKELAINSVNMPEYKKEYAAGFKERDAEAAWLTCKKIFNKYRAFGIMPTELQTIRWYNSPDDNSLNMAYSYALTRFYKMLEWMQCPRTSVTVGWTAGRRWQVGGHIKIAAPYVNNGRPFLCVIDSVTKQLLSRTPQVTCELIILENIRQSGAETKNTHGDIETEPMRHEDLEDKPFTHGLIQTNGV